MHEQNLQRLLPGMQYDTEHTNLILYHTNLILYPTNLILYHTNLILYHTNLILYHTNLIRIFATELGNELNNNNNGDGAPCNLVPQQQAKAVLNLANLVRVFLPGTVIIGPDTGYNNPAQWLTGFLPYVNGRIPLL